LQINIFGEIFNDWERTVRGENCVTCCASWGKILRSCFLCAEGKTTDWLLWKKKYNIKDLLMLFLKFNFFFIKISWCFYIKEKFIKIFNFSPHQHASFVHSSCSSRMLKVVIEYDINNMNKIYEEPTSCNIIKDFIKCISRMYFASCFSQY
jgi:hypothetical protein